LGSLPVKIALFILLSSTFLTPTLSAAVPVWWSERGVLEANNPADDYAAANLGQLKHFASKAAAELNANLPGGAGTAINNLITSWQQPPAAGVTRDDYAAVNQGQLKSIAKSFYDRLFEVGYTGPPLTPGQKYPWDNSPTPADDYALANLGQLKQIFSFKFATDTDTDGLSDVWEQQIIDFSPDDDITSVAQVLPGDDFDGDGLTNLEEYLQGSDPRDYYNGQAPVVVIRGGDSQSGLPGEIVPLPLWVRIKNADHVAIPYATIRYSIEGANGQIALSPTGTFLTTQDIQTDSQGEAFAYLKLSGTNGAVNRVKVTFGTGVQAVSRHFEAKVSIPPPTPVLTIVSANNQTGTPGEYLLQPLRVEVRDGSPTGPPLRNRDVTFSVSSGAGGFAVVSGISPASINKTVTTDANGVAEIYFQLPTVPGLINTITAQCIGAKIVDFVVTSAFSSTDLPPAPQAIRILENADGSIDYSWTDVSANEEYFFIEREKADGSLERINLPANSTNYLYVPQP